MSSDDLTQTASDESKLDEPSNVVTKRTFCRVCEPACGMLAKVSDDKLIALEPDPQHPISKGFVCNKGIYGAQMHNDPDRLRYPQKRDAEGNLQRISWDQAFAEIGAKFRAITEESGAGALASYSGNPSAFNALFGPSFGNLVRNLGIRKHFSSGTQDCANKFAGSEAVFGTRTLHPVPDFENSDFILLLGENPKVSHMSFLSIPHPMSHLKAAERRGAKIVFVNPRQIESAHRLGSLVQVKPDSDVYLLAAMLHSLDREGLLDTAAANQHADHLEPLRAFLTQYSPERVAAVVGIDAAAITQLARDFATAPSACAHMSTGVNMGRQGTLAYWLLHMLVLLTGNLGRRGGNFFSQGFYARSTAAGTRVPAGEMETKYGSMRTPGGVGINLPAVLMSQYLTEPSEPVRGMLVCSGNPLLSVAGEQDLQKAFAQLDLLVCVDIYPNATSEFAHYLLPAAGAFEREDINLTGLGMQYRPSVQFTEAVVPAAYERRPDWWIFERLSQAMGAPSMFDDDEQPNPWARVDAMLRSRGNSMQALREEQVLVFDVAEPQALFDEHLPTEDKRIDCFPEQFESALQRMEHIFIEMDNEAPDQLKLISKRDAYMFNSWFSNIDKLKQDEREQNYLFMHPLDAQLRQLEDNALVQIRSAHGAVDVHLQHSDDLRRGVVAMSHGWGHQQAQGLSVASAKPGVNCNRLLPSGPGSYEPLSNQAHMTGIPVEVTPR